MRFSYLLILFLTSCRSNDKIELQVENNSGYKVISYFDSFNSKYLEYVCLDDIGVKTIKKIRHDSIIELNLIEIDTIYVDRKEETLVIEKRTYSKKLFVKNKLILEEIANNSDSIPNCKCIDVCSN